MLTAGVNTAGYSCSGVATLEFTQNGSSLGGSYTLDGTCTTPHDRRDDDASGAIAAGSVSGNTVSFEAADCTFEGTVEGAAGRITGTVQCDSQAALAVAFAGYWVAARV